MFITCVVWMIKMGKILIALIRKRNSFERAMALTVCIMLWDKKWSEDGYVDNRKKFKNFIMDEIC